ncbi:hypothetical protein Cyast_2680 [Cyanobacterium stanieri PCC 7202]|uniref:Lipoprotein n=1 Tax=Cyanobacterium stanieri (strain ATCC 29140 / PCC 7202) TaxID=292563 RepID=K9YRA1_CYASC|nr:hypothetical protein Cyast_2680 [Cyanobacterium stanieri PCC 7202]
MKISYFLLSLLIIGCADSKTSSCRQLFNFTSTLQETITNLDDNNLQAIADTANTFELTSQAIANYNFEDANLGNNAIQLSQIYQAYADNTRDFVDAYQIKNQEKGILSQQNLTDLFIQQRQLVEQINNYCNQ